MRKIYSIAIVFIFLSIRSWSQCAVGVGPTFPSGCVSQYFTSITAGGAGVTSTIAYSAGSCIGTFFNNFTTQGVTAPTGSTVSINVSRLSSYYAYLAVYVDWNNNGTYETTELSGSIITMPVGLVSTVYNFNIPLIGIVTNTNLHMRVFLGEPPSSGGALSTINPPCSAKWGEACDYYLNATCTNPVITCSPAAPGVCGPTGSVTLTAGGAGTTPTYLWSPASGLSATTGATVTSTPGSTATYTITGYGPGVCLGTGTVTVSVNPIPTPVITASGPTSICPGSSITLTETSGTGTLYQWYAGGSAITGATTSSYTASPAATTTYSISLTTTAGCTAGATVPVTILPVPVAVITPTGPTTVCAPATVTLGGTIGVGYTYQWYNGSGVIAGATTQTYTATATGTYSVQVTATGGCSDTSASVSVTINAAPAPVITASGATSFCAGSNLTLTETSGTGTLYQWYDATSAIPGGTNASYVASPTITTTYSVSVTNSVGCSNGATIALTILPTPVAVITPAGPTTVCAPGTVTLNATVGTGYTYQWYNAGGVISGASTQTYTATATGSYSVLITSAGGCKDTSAGTSVTIASSPVPVITAGGPVTFCAGGSVVLTETSGTGSLYQWYDGTTAIAGATNVSYTASPAITTTYSISVSNAGGCNGGSTFTVTILPKPVAVITPAGPTTVCAPNGVVLNANFAAGYTYRWFTLVGVIAGATTQTYTAFASGSYAVEITTGGGCKDTSEPVTVTINPKPVATATASGPLTFCAYDSVVLTAGPGYTYQWLDGTTILAGATNISYTANVPGTHDYRVIVINGFGCSDTTAAGLFPVVVNPAPISTITASGPLAFCTGGSVTLSVPAVAGYTYQWYGGSSVITAAPISGATGASYTATTTGFYYVVVTTPAGCTTNSSAAPAIVTLVTTPLISYGTPLHFCWGSHVTLSVGISAGAAGITIQWLRNSIAIPGATGNTFNAIESGIYTCAITVTGSCVGTTPPVTVTVHALPDPVISYSGGWLQTQNFYTSYQWYADVTAVSGGTTYRIHPLVTGSYAVRVTDTNGCISVADAYPVTNLTPTETGKVNAYNLPVIAPNPASEILYVQYATPVNITITSVDGKKLIEKRLSNEINVAQLANGIYLIALYDEEGKRLITEKFVKE